MDRAKQKQLVVRWQTVGDQDAANDLYAFLCCRLRPAANRLLWRTSGQSVDDLISETLQVFVRNVEGGRFKPDGTASPLTYATSILRNKVLNSSRVRRPYLLDPAVLVGVVDRSGDSAPAASDHCWQSKIDAMIECFSRLPEQLRTVYSLCLGLDVLEGRVVEFEDCKQERVANIMGKSRAWVSKQCVRAAQWTRECVESKLEERRPM